MGDIFTGIFNMVLSAASAVVRTVFGLIGQVVNFFRGGFGAYDPSAQHVDISVEA